MMACVVPPLFPLTYAQVLLLIACVLFLAYPRTETFHIQHFEEYKL